MDSMPYEAQELLQRFQCDFNRQLEERFAQTFSESEDVRLFFINEDEAFTDGRNIVVDPAVSGLFYDKKALRQIEKFLALPPVVLVDSWNVLRLITRAQTIHECLHLLYSDFPPRAAKERLCTTRNQRRTLALIGNIIEDAYIEAVGCSVYDNLESYLKFGRVSHGFATKSTEGTAQKAFNSSKNSKNNKNGKNSKAEKDGKDVSKAAEDGDEAFAEEQRKADILIEYLDYMAGFLLYPMFEQLPPAECIASYVEKTQELFTKGSTSASPLERYNYSVEVYKIILPLIPEDSVGLAEQELSLKINGLRTHNPDNVSLGSKERKGRKQAVSVRLFVNADGSPRGNKANAQNIKDFMAALQEFAKDKEAALEIIDYRGFTKVFQGTDYKCSPLHRDIKIREEHPAVNLNLRKAYQNICQQFRLSINSYNSRFLQLLRAKAEIREEKLYYGHGISSSRLGSVDKRYWYRKIEGQDVPDLAVMLLVDGSGSMSGKRIRSAINASVILHEVLAKQEIVHAIVEHRAMGYKPEIEVNVMAGFQGRKEEKYNILQMKGNGDNRDGLALFWAERYMHSNVNAEHKLLIVLSDGYPAHCYDDYYPPVSSQDTANAVKAIIKRGINVVAVALNDNQSEDDLYDEDDEVFAYLKEIYPHLVDCRDLKRLPGQILGTVAKLL